MFEWNETAADAFVRHVRPRRTHLRSVRGRQHPPRLFHRVSRRNVGVGHGAADAGHFVAGKMLPE